MRSTTWATRSSKEPLPLEERADSGNNSPRTGTRPCGSPRGVQIAPAAAAGAIAPSPVRPGCPRPGTGEHGPGYFPGSVSAGHGLLPSWTPPAHVMDPPGIGAPRLGRLRSARAARFASRGCGHDSRSRRGGFPLVQPETSAPSTSSGETWPGSAIPTPASAERIAPSQGRPPSTAIRGGSPPETKLSGVVDVLIGAAAATREGGQGGPPHPRRLHDSGSAGRPEVPTRCDPHDHRNGARDETDLPFVPRPFAVHGLPMSGHHVAGLGARDDGLLTLSQGLPQAGRLVGATLRAAACTAPIPSSNPTPGTQGPRRVRAPGRALGRLPSNGRRCRVG